jgi:hypothetical protein
MLTVLAFMMTALQAAPLVEPCAHDRAALLALSPDAFDQDRDGGWRPLAEKTECQETAADLLAEYRAAHWGSLAPGDLHVNYWHEGQIRASVGQTERAVRLLMAGVNPEVQGDGFQEYAIGTAAFLNGDHEGLQAARDRLAALPPPADWAETVASFRQQFGVEVKWPANLDVLDGLLACFGRPYDEAYGASCRP